jgi:hypothetical protein
MLSLSDLRKEMQLKYDVNVDSLKQYYMVRETIKDVSNTHYSAHHRQSQ